MELDSQLDKCEWSNHYSLLLVAASGGIHLTCMVVIIEYNTIAYYTSIQTRCPCVSSLLLYAAPIV
jgi:hypothetical protein